MNIPTMIATGIIGGRSKPKQRIRGEITLAPEQAKAIQDAIAEGKHIKLVIEE